MGHNIICKCGHSVENHTYSKDYTGCDLQGCKCAELVPAIVAEYFQSRLTALEQAAAKVYDIRRNRGGINLSELSEAIDALAALLPANGGE